MSNLYGRLKALFPDPPLQVGDVISVAGGTVVVQVPGGGRVNVRGEATAGDRVYFRDGAIEGPAPTLPLDVIEV